MRSVLVPLFALLLMPQAPAQGTPKEVFEKVMEAQKEAMKGVKPADRAKVAAEIQEAAKDAIEKNDKLLSSGEGLYYKARLQQIATPRDAEAVVEAFKAAVAAAPESPLAHEARVRAAQMLSTKSPEEAKKLLADVKAEKLTDETRRMLESLRAPEVREALNGKPAPAIKALKVLNGPAADFSLTKYHGKVVLLDFWATWCPPCRAVIPELVKMQEAQGKDGLQVLGITRYYGYGMDFEADSKLPHGGKTVGSRDKKISEAEEVTVNEHFIPAFKVNYPIVFSEENLGGKIYGVTGIPTIYVIGRDGKVVGHVVGGGEKQHKELEEMVTAALAAKPAGEAKGGGH